MNFHIHSSLAELGKAKPVVEHAEHEDGKAKPSAQLITAAKAAARGVGKQLGGKDLSVEVHGHETTTGRGFRPGHVSVVVSRVDPKA